MDETNGWMKWEQHVLLELKDNKEKLVEITKCMNTMKIEQEKLKVQVQLRTAIIAVASSVGTIAVALFYMWMSGRL